MATGALEAQTAERWLPELAGSAEPAPAWVAAGARDRRALQAGLAAFESLALGAAVLLAVLGAPGNPAARGAVDWLLAGGSLFFTLAWRRAAPACIELLDELRSLAAAVTLPTLALVGLAEILGAGGLATLGARLWVLGLVIGGGAVLGRRWILRGATSVLLRPTLIVGAGGVGRELAAQLAREPQHGLRVVGFMEPRRRRCGQDPGDEQNGSGQSAPPARALAPVLGPPERLAAAIRSTGAECVIFGFTSQPDSLLVPLIEQCRRLGVAVLAVPRLYEVARREHARRVGPLPVIELRPLDPHGPAFAAKHALDRVLAALLLLAAAPLLAVLAVAIRLDSPGPVLYRQRRVGRDGRQFEMLKLRTMHPAAGAQPAFVPPAGCAPGGNELGDRCTRVGVWLRRASLDELPQLINVLRGEMSLIGPRPERPEYVERFNIDVAGYDRRHRVKSGITGLAQVNGLRGQTSIFHRARYDNAYIEQWSFWLDLKIALRTLGVVIFLRGR